MKKRRWLKLLFFLIGFLILVKLLMVFAIEPFLKNKIEARLNTSHTYRVEIGKIKIYLLTSEVKIFQINIHADQTAMDSASISAKLTGSIQEVSFKGIRFFKAFFKKEYVVDELRISGAQVSRKQLIHEPSEKTNADHGIRIPYSIKIKKINFKNSTLLIEDTTGMNKYRMINFNIPEIALDMCVINKNDTFTSRVFENIHYEISDIKSLSQDSMYKMELHHVNGNSFSLSVDSILLIPQYDDYAFAARNKIETDRIHLVLKKLTLDNFRFVDLLDKQDILAGHVNINKMDMDVFRDKRMKDNTKKKPMMQELLMQYTHQLKIDTLVVNDGNIKYTEHAEDATKPGKIYFTHSEATLLNFTNDPAEAGNTMKVHAKAFLMNKSNMNVSISFPVNDPQNSFQCFGSVASMNIEDLNSFIEKNEYVYATGEIKKINFNFTADNLKSQGDLEFIYDNLHLTAKNKRTDDTTALKEKIISFITNKIIIKKSNPSPGESVRTGIIDYQRNPEKFLFNYCFNSVLTGIRSTVQLPEKKKEKEKKQ